jgi:hypothetical protein
MSETLRLVLDLIQRGDVRVSAHGYEELTADGILAREVIDGVQAAVVVEDYPTFAKGPCGLVRQFDEGGRPIHAVWGIPKARRRPPCWSPPIGRIRLGGPTTFCGRTV